MVSCAAIHHRARCMVLLLSHGTFQSRRHPQPWRRGWLWRLASRLRQGLLRGFRQILPDVREGRAYLPKLSFISLIASSFGGCPHGPNWHMPGGLLGFGLPFLLSLGYLLSPTPSTHGAMCLLAISHILLPCPAVAACTGEPLLTHGASAQQGTTRRGSKAKQTSARRQGSTQPLPEGKEARNLCQKARKAHSVAQEYESWGFPCSSLVETS